MRGSWIGSWWRPGRSEEVGGELVVGDGGCVLKLFGSFADQPPDVLPLGGWGPDKRLSEPVIHGFADGVSFTLLDAECAFPRPPHAFGSERWIAAAAIECHVISTAEPVFRSVRVAFDDLPMWASARQPQQAWYVDEGHGTEFKMRSHSLVEAVLDDGSKLTIDQGTSSTREGDSWRLEMPVSLSLSPSSGPAPWERLLERLTPVFVLAWVATGRAPAIERLWVEVEESEYGVKWAALWVAIDQPTGSTERREIRPDEVLFRVQDLPGGPGPGLDRWLAFWADVRHLILPPFARSRRPGFTNDQFASAIAAMEGYHRYCQTSSRDLPTAEHRARVRRLRTTLEEHAPDLTEWAVNSTRDFNRMSLRRRIEEFADTLDAVGPALFGDDSELFAQVAEAARNGAAHAIPRPDPLADESAGLYFAAKSLLWLLRSAFLVDLGFDLDQAQLRVLRDPSLEETASQMRKVLARLRSADPPDAE